MKIYDSDDWCFNDVDKAIEFMYKTNFTRDVAIYDINDDKNEWFNKCKELCDKLGYASDMKEYKANPEKYKGNVADVTTVIRVALTKRAQTPDLYELLKLIGVDGIKSRFEKVA